MEILHLVSSSCIFSTISSVGSDSTSSPLRKYNCCGLYLCPGANLLSEKNNEVLVYIWTPFLPESIFLMNKDLSGLTQFLRGGPRIEFFGGSEREFKPKRPAGPQFCLVLHLLVTSNAVSSLLASVMALDNVLGWKI